MRRLLSCFSSSSGQACVLKSPAPHSTSRRCMTSSSRPGQQIIGHGIRAIHGVRRPRFSCSFSSATCWAGAGTGVADGIRDGSAGVRDSRRFSTTTVMESASRDTGVRQALPGADLVASWLILPIEIISHCARVLSLTVRLYANMFAGDMVYSGLLLAYSDRGADLSSSAASCSFHVVQAVVFMLLALIYLAGAVAVEEH